MKVKTSELVDAALDWSVAEAAGYLSRLGDHWMVTVPGVRVRMNFVPGPRCAFSPSTRWAQGGPIMEQEGIELTMPRLITRDKWCATRIEGPAVSEEYGLTPLIAAMRCYVASQMGDEVDVPNDFYCQTTPNS